MVDQFSIFTEPNSSCFWLKEGVKGWPHQWGEPEEEEEEEGEEWERGKGKEKKRGSRRQPKTPRSSSSSSSSPSSSSSFSPTGSRAVPKNFQPLLYENHTLEIKNAQVSFKFLFISFFLSMFY